MFEASLKNLKFLPIFRHLSFCSSVMSNVFISSLPNEANGQDTIILDKLLFPSSSSCNELPATKHGKFLITEIKSFQKDALPLTAQRLACSKIMRTYLLAKKHYFKFRTATSTATNITVLKYSLRSFIFLTISSHICSKTSRKLRFRSLCLVHVVSFAKFLERSTSKLERIKVTFSVSWDKKVQGTASSHL